MFNIGINFDEISDELSEALVIMKKEGLTYGEIRTINKKNFVYFTDDELQELKKTLQQKNITLIAGASPLFKWYTVPDFPEVTHDNFGFTPRISDAEKKKHIDRAIDCAVILGIRYLRIFSNLDDGSLQIEDFINDPMLQYALEKAKQENIMLLVENEPVCIVRRKADIVKLFASVQHANLGLWLDIANLVELGEAIDDTFIQEVAHKISYLHVKDFLVLPDNPKKYVALGEGSIDYATILSKLAPHLIHNDVCITVETHVPSDRIQASVASIRALKKLEKGLPI